MDTKQKVGLVFIIFIIFVGVVIIIAILEGTHAKPEFLAEEERWQINAHYIEQFSDTSITLKYLGENYVDVLGYTTYSISSIGNKYSQDFRVIGGHICSLNKGETHTFRAANYVYNVTISWKTRYGGGHSFFATFNVLSVDDFPD